MKFISHPHHAVLTLRNGKQLEALSLGWIFSCATHVLEDGGNTRKPVNTGIDNQTQFVYQPFDKQCAIENTATLYRYATDAELTTDSLKSFPKIGRIADDKI